MRYLLDTQQVEETTAATAPDFHKDPADRIIIATSLANDLTVATGDGKFSQYGVRTIC